MSEIWLEAQDRPPLTARFYSRVPIQPIWIGVLIALLYLLSVVVYFSLLGGDNNFMPQGEPFQGRRFWEIPGWWTLIVNAVMIGFAPTVMVSSLRSVERDVRDLAPALGETPEGVDALIREVVRLNPHTMRLVGLGTGIAMIGMSFLDPGLWDNRDRPSLTNPLFLWFVAQQVLLGWLLSRAIVADLATARSFADLARRIPRVDLFDLRPLGVFARRAVRSVLYWMVGLAVFSLFWFGPNAGESNVVTFVLMIALAGRNLTVLLGSARRRIRQEKDVLLSRIRDGIRSDQQALLASGRETPEAASRLPALLAIEARIVSVAELPFDANTFLRFTLYVTLGIGSWVGGALIERLLGAALDR